MSLFGSIQDRSDGFVWDELPFMGILPRVGDTLCR